MSDEHEYEAWLRTVPPEITADTIWRMTAYRDSLYLAVQSQSDLVYVLNHRRTRAYGDQLLRAVGGISANLDEGYSRSSGRERAHFYEYALGSTREARGWYYKCAIALPEAIWTARIGRLTRIVRILTVVVPREREANSMFRRRATQLDQNANPDHPAATSSS